MMASTIVHLGPQAQSEVLGAANKPYLATRNKDCPSSFQEGREKREGRVDVEESATTLKEIQRVPGKVGRRCRGAVPSRGYARRPMPETVSLPL